MKAYWHFVVRFSFVNAFIKTRIELLICDTSLKSLTFVSLTLKCLLSCFYDVIAIIDKMFHIIKTYDFSLNDIVLQNVAGSSCDRKLVRYVNDVREPLKCEI